MRLFLAGFMLAMVISILGVTYVKKLEKEKQDKWVALTNKKIANLLSLNHDLVGYIRSLPSKYWPQKWQGKT